MTGLLLAVRAGDKALVRSFIDAKADLEARDVILIRDIQLWRVMCCDACSFVPTYWGLTAVNQSIVYGPGTNMILVLGPLVLPVYCSIIAGSIFEITS